jgi:ATP-dependent Clp protease ATP-binding subunit ClpA
LVDEAASALRLAQESKPDELESLEREIMTLQIELESLKNENDTFSVERRNKVEQELREKREEAAALTGVWQTGEWTEIRRNSRLIRGLCRKISAGQDQRCQAQTGRSQAPIGRSTTTGPIRARLAPAVLYHPRAATPASRGGGQGE